MRLFYTTVGSSLFFRLADDADFGAKRNEREIFVFPSSVKCFGDIKGKLTL